MAEDDGPLFLSHGDVLGVVVPVIAEDVELSLKFMGDGEYEGIVGGRCEVVGTEEGSGFGLEEMVCVCVCVCVWCGKEYKEWRRAEVKRNYREYTEQSKRR